ncbi:MAG: SDR family NAD(P)-dependent oxidoreductase [Sphingopyxis sp.]|uniref:SDR family NAD(P)-dependent oxidoreductase n=1 Tax=Sphingopyxis sp. TaxID=1908224 RepID=UPI002ABCF7F8|nr:SDR family NAD(P)-dependent oxidoreductase [Sphingopyxis sp.]MDZ3832418.1 SDR family NAD(P)-dependent oxidoreductase [Sphingopyxis sp.]
MKLENKTIVLTGGRSGIGSDLLSQLIGQNTIINLSRNAPAIAAPARKDSCRHISTDLADAASVAGAISKIKELCPDGIDGLINCAAVQFLPQFVADDFEHNSIAKEIAVNFTSPAELISGLLDSMLKRPEAFVFNVNSGLGIVPKHESAIYCASKAALDNLTRGLRAQLAHTSVRMQQAFLPLVDTPMTTGRGSGKISSASVAGQIIRQIESGTLDLDIGKVKMLRSINRISPALAHRIMQKGGS